MKYVCLFALLGATACAPVPDDTSGVVDISDRPGGIEQGGDEVELEECDAADYRPLIGTTVTDTVFPTGERLRVYSEADIVTQEYIPQRTNVVFDTSGKIVRVFCS
ncbi:MAG: hypothetical protein HKN27_00470 [Silicimonas sp.]|nr:hypothetical protein [Silicimonas sp.]